MIRDALFTPFAINDIDQASAWYEEQREGLSERFRSALDESIERVLRTPEMFEVVHNGVRRAILRRFPFCVYFRQEVDRIVVLGVIHTSRADEIWKSRVEKG